MPKPSDLTYQGIDPANGLYCVHEALYPESRGYKVYHFASEGEAREFERTGKLHA